MKKTLLLVLGLCVSEVSADVISSIVFKGLGLVDKEALDECITITPEEEFGQSEVEATIKALFAKGFFSDVKIVKNGRTLIIECTEKPMINKIAFEGNDALKDEALKSVINGRIADGSMLENYLVRDCIADIKAVYASLGYYAVKITPKIIKYSKKNKKVDIVFEIIEGSKTTVKKILFIGNKSFSDDELKDVLSLKEERIWRFGSEYSVFGEEMIAESKKALTEFYNNNGFPFFSIRLASAEMGNDKTSHYCTFIVDEGDIFKIQKITLQSKVKQINVKAFRKFITLKTGEVFNKSLINQNRTAVLREISLKNNPFIDIMIQTDFDKAKKTATINYIVVEKPKIFIEKIDIVGNTRTLDKVIRREFSVHEGDPLNVYKMEKTLQTLNGIGYFSSVNISEKNGSSEDKKVLVVTVKESDSTSNIRFGLSAGTIDGFGGFIGFTENNLFGTGRTFGTEVFWSQKHHGCSVDLYDPHFMDKNFGAGIKVGIEQNSSMKNVDYSVRDSKFVSSYVRYNITEYLSHMIAYTLSSNDKKWWDKTTSKTLPTPPVSAVNDLTKSEYGKFTSGELTSSLTYERVDNHYEPRDGYSISLNNTYSGLVGNVQYFKNSMNARYYYPINKKLTFIVNGVLGHLYEIKNTRTNHRFSLGGGDDYGMRGFDIGGIGPRDADERSLGGNKFWTLSCMVKAPLSSKDIGINGIVFLDLGSAWDTKYKKITGVKDSSSIRASVGIAIEWVKCPLGMPMSFVFGFPIKKQSFDMKRIFSLNGFM
jgi:outer membrane protein insertion porin family